MAMQTIDLTNFRDRQGSKVPEGTYVVQIEDIEVGESSRKKTPEWIVYTRVVGGDYDGSALTDRIYITEAALFRVVAFLNSVGIKTPNKRIQVDTNRLVGRKFVANIRDGEPYQGQVRSEFGSYERYVPSSSESPDLEDVLEVEEVEEPVQAKKGKRGKKGKKAEASRDPWEVVEEESETVDDVDVDLDDIEL